MATRRAHCPRCGLRLEFRALAGERVVCGNCGARLRVVGRTGRTSGDNPLVGRRLGDYEIVELLGRGGMGWVYKAREASRAGYVALKLLPRAADSESVARLAREARTASAVRDPHIIEVYGSGHVCGLPFVAMEFVEGGSLAEVVAREGYVDASRAVGLMRQLAQALAKAHAVGLVHRDIKPSNILLTAGGDAKLADFGLAKRPVRGARAARRAPAMGTACYMSPEAALGRPIDARSDLYSLGATFYHALAGRPPFRGNSDTAVLAEQVSGEPLSLGEARPDLPRELRWVVHRLLRKSPSERFQSAGELLGALDVVAEGLDAPRLEDTEVMAWSPSPFDTPPTRRKRRAAWVAGAGLAVLLAAALVLAARAHKAEGAAEPPPRVSQSIR